MQFTEALATLEAMPDKVRLFLRDADEAQLTKRDPKKPDFFNLREHVAHLRDVDVEAYEKRVGLILEQEHPMLADLDGGRLAVERQYHLQDVGEAFEAFAAARERIVARLRAAGEGSLGRTAHLEGVGEITLGQLLEIWIQHDREHLSDLESLRNG